MMINDIFAIYADATLTKNASGKPNIAMKENGNEKSKIKIREPKSFRIFYYI